MSSFAAAQPISASSWRSWRIVMLLVAFSFMTWFNRVSMAVAYDSRIGPEYGVSEEAMGAVYSAFLLSYLLFMTPGGWFIDRFGAKPAILIAALGSGLFGALTSLAGLTTILEAGLLVTGLLVVRFAMGLFSAPYYPAAACMVSIWVPKDQRAFANGLNQAAANIGMACAFPLFGALVDLWDWPAAFVASGVVTMFLGLLWWVSVPGQPPTTTLVAPETAYATAAVEPSSSTEMSQDERPISAFSLLRNRNVMLLTISYATMGYLGYLFFFWMNHYLGQIPGIDKDEGRKFTAILFLSMAVGMVSGGWLADRLRRSVGGWFGWAAVPITGMSLSAVFLGFGLVSDGIFWIVFWLALALLAVGLAESPTWMAAVELGGRHGGMSAAILNTGGNLGGFIAPMLTPIVSHAVRDYFGVSDHVGWQLGIMLAGVLCLIGASLWWWIRPDEKAG